MPEHYEIKVANHLDPCWSEWFANLNMTYLEGDVTVLSDPLPEEGQSLMRTAMTQLNLSARAYHRILKLARTIADLTGSEEIQSVRLTEALQYRPKLMLS